MVARGQAQTAADAAVLAAAQSMAFDNSKDEAHFKLVGQKVGQSNAVWGASPDILLSDIDFPNCPPTLAWSTTEKCVRAHVYRNQARNDPLPTFFANIFGLSSQGVRATATARAIAANATNCLKPWAVGDKWLDTQVGGWSQSAEYKPADGDVYTPPTATDPGTGFSARDANDVPTYYGYQMVLKLATPGQGNNEIPIYSGGWAMELELANDAGGGNAAYTANITGCTSETVAIAAPGTTCTVANPPAGCVGVKTGSGGMSNKKAIEDFINGDQRTDPHDPTEHGQMGRAATGGPARSSKMNPQSRIVPVAIVDIPQDIAAG